MEKFIPKYSNAQVIEELKKGNNEVVECFFYWKGPSIKELNDKEDYTSNLCNCVSRAY